MESHWKLLHIGMPVRDIDETLRNFTALGATEFSQEILVDSSEFAEYKVYGNDPDPVVKTKVQMAKVGSIWMELLQPLQGETVHKEFLEGVGEGIGHLAYRVDDLEAEAEKMVEKGFSIILTTTPKGQTRRYAIYFDTRSKFNNTIIELVQDNYN
ncbi:MAG: hypothetical protein GY866_03505 [Proteobacteria bacterium]|nr:hypothetical protein [Pseudomonadota bacterium]